MAGINGDYGNFSKNIPIGQNNAKNNAEIKNSEVKETINLAGNTYQGEKTDLGQTGNVYGALGVQFSTFTVDEKIAAALDPKTVAYLNNTSAPVAARIAKETTETYAALEATNEFA